MDHLYDWMTGIGTLVAGVGAIYAAFAGVKTYRDGLSVRLVQSLFEIEAAFKSTFPLMATLEDDKAYSERIAPIIKRAAGGADLTPDELATIEKVDLAIRFFYLLWVRTQIVKAEGPLVNVYRYYFSTITDATKRSELRGYVQKFYVPLSAWL